MNKFMLICLTLFAFAFAGCGKSKQEKCEEKAEKVWNAETKECEDKATEATDATEEAANDNATEEATYTITNLVAGVTLTVNSLNTASSNLVENGCVIVKESQFATLQVSADVILCDNRDKKQDDAATVDVDESLQANTDNDCAAGNYNLSVKADASGNELTVAAAKNEAETCVALKPVNTAPAAE